jgi:hypothetical protein
MGTLKNFRQSRMQPTPIGNPELIFSPWSFGQMKPLPLQPFTITTANAWQTYASIFIPANTWAINKLLFAELGLTIILQAINQPGGPTYAERYFVNAMGNTPRLAPAVALAFPQQCHTWIQRQFIWDGTDIYELAYNGVTLNNSASHPDSTDHRLRFGKLVAPFDPTVDNYIEFQLMTSFPASTDVCSTFTGQAFIQAPFNLGRLPR